MSGMLTHTWMTHPPDAVMPTLMNRCTIMHSSSMAKTWLRSGTLYSFGSALELCKCFWYLMCWQWIKGQPQLATMIDTPGMIALTSGCTLVYSDTKGRSVCDQTNLQHSSST
jgi:hypothetical protein